MKKIVFAVILGLLVQVIPCHAVPSKGEMDPTSTTVILGAVLGSALLVFDGGAKPSVKKTGNEFSDLNNNPVFASLQGQIAGGSMDSLEIIK